MEDIPPILQQFDYQFGINHPELGPDFEHIVLADKSPLVRAIWRVAELLGTKQQELYDIAWIVPEDGDPEEPIPIASIELDWDPNSGREGFVKDSVFLVQAEDLFVVDYYIAVWRIDCSLEEIVPEPVESS